jgi:hypothetical protein
MYFFIWLTALAKVFSTILKWEEVLINFSPFSMGMAVSFSNIFFIVFILSLLNFFEAL